MLYSYSKLFLYFFICSMIGYIIEVINTSYNKKKLVLSRGFLIGPYLPIYGVGAMLMTAFLKKYEQDVIVLFIMSTFICSTLEYITSYIMEKIFKVRWWDYKNKKYNLDGRICLENGLLFGIAGVWVIKMLNPILFTIGNKLSAFTILLLGIILSVVFYSDLIESAYIVSKLKINTKKYSKKDATEEVRKKVIKELYKHNTLTARLLKAFPNIKNTERKEYRDFNNLVFNIKEEVKKLKQEEKLKTIKQELKKERKKLKDYKKQTKRIK